MTEIWTIKKLLDWSNDFFLKNNIESPKLTAQFLLSDVLDMKRLDLFLKFDQELSKAELKKYKEYVIRRKEHEPVEHILGSAAFLDFDVAVNKNVLIPRPETEILANEAIQVIKEKTPSIVVDIGTGSGVLAISIKKAFPDLLVWATDISNEALSVAELNAQNNKTDIRFFNGFFPDIDLKEGQSVLIVSNPPYIPSSDIEGLEPEVKNYDPMLALDGGEKGLNVIDDIFKLIQGAKAKICLLMEIGFDQHDDIKELAKKYGLTELNFITDQNDYQRIVRIDK